MVEWEPERSKGLGGRKSEASPRAECTENEGWVATQQMDPYSRDICVRPKDKGQQEGAQRTAGISDVLCCGNRFQWPL